MANPIQLRVDSPCAQHWDQMTPADQGRYCSACQKTVIDFTAMTDREVVDWVSRHPAGFCGRFVNGQLNRDLHNPPQQRTAWHSRWNYLLAAVLFSSEVSAQQKPATPGVTQVEDAGRPREMASTRQPSVSPPVREIPDVIRGQVISKEDHNPVWGATVSIVGTHSAVATDSKGKFVINSHMLQGSHVLEVSSVGFETIRVDLNTIPLSGDSMGLLILPVSQTLVGDVVIVTKKKHRSPAQILTDTLSAIGIIDKALSVYPNPVNRGGSITVALRLRGPGPYTVQLFSLTGVLMETMEVTGEQRSTDVLMNIPPTATPGNYFVRLSGSSGTGAAKVHTQQLVIL